MNRGSSFVLCLVYFCFRFCPLAWAQDPQGYELIELSVVAISSGGIYLDGGRQRGIEAGDRVELYPHGELMLAGKLSSVSRSTARLQLDDPGATAPELGTRVVVFVPRARLMAAAQRAAHTREAKAPSAQEPSQIPVENAAQVPERDHPPWEHPPVAWAEDTPLLAPIATVEPGDRPREWSGRIRFGADWLDDRTSGGRAYAAARAGVDLELGNPFNRGGRLQLDLEAYYRSIAIADEPDETSSRLRLDRFSYAFGGVRGAPERYEFGRFLASEFPELGLVDGFEWVRRLDSGDRMGLNAGILPEWDDQLGTGDDQALAAFYRWVASEAEELALGAALQKTWHKGESDRDLLVLTGDWHPNAQASVHTSAWVDWYGSADEAKGSGPELTRLFANANFSLGANTGLGLFFTHYRFPELIDEYDPDLALDLALERTSRLSLSLWHALSASWRVYVRADAWEDREESGAGGELRLSARNYFWQDGELALALYDTGGRFSSGIGARLSAAHSFGKHGLRLEFEATDYDQQGVFGDHEQLLQDALRASWETRLDSLDLALWLEERFGDEQDSTAVGFSLSRRF